MWGKYSISNWKMERQKGNRYSESISIRLEPFIIVSYLGKLSKINIKSLHNLFTILFYISFALLIIYQIYKSYRNVTVS